MPLINYLDEKHIGGGFQGDLFQAGYGSPSFQRGRGLGSLVSKIRSSPFLSKFKRNVKSVAKPILSKIIAKSKPHAKQFGKKILDSALNVGKESLTDILINKKPPREVVKNKGAELKRKVVEAANDSLKLMSGKGYASKAKRPKPSLKQGNKKSQKNIKKTGPKEKKPLLKKKGKKNQTTSQKKSSNLTTSQKKSSNLNKKKKLDKNKSKNKKNNKKPLTTKKGKKQLRQAYKAERKIQTRDNLS